MKTIISYPKLLAKIMQAKRHNEARLHFAMKMVDEKGQGRYTLDQLKEKFCSDNETKLFSSKRLKGILHSGNGLFWDYYPKKEVVFYYAPVRIAEGLELDSVGSKQVIVPFEAVFDSIKQFKAFCHQAFLASVDQLPIGRKKLETEIGVSDDTMRSYESVSFDSKTKVGVRGNYILLCEGYNPKTAEHQELVYQYGRVVRYVYKGKVYTACKTANSYLSPIELINGGRTERKIINKRLKHISGQAGTFANKVFYRYQSRGCEAGDYLLQTTEFGANARRPSKLGVSNVWGLIG